MVQSITKRYAARMETRLKDSLFAASPWMIRPGTPTEVLHARGARRRDPARGESVGRASSGSTAPPRRMRPEADYTPRCRAGRCRQRSRAAGVSRPTRTAAPLLEQCRTVLQCRPWGERTAKAALSIGGGNGLAAA